MKSNMMKMIEDLTPLNRVFCSSDYDKVIEYLGKELDFFTHRYTNKEQINGWVIPPKWDVIEAKITCNGELIYDGLQHPLSVIALSKSFKGTVTLPELLSHLHFDHRFPNAIPYHFRQLYRSWERDWGFCVTENFYNELKNIDTTFLYDVEIVTKEEEGTLKVLVSNLSIYNKPTFFFVAHLDHPGMSNDDLAGCAVGIELLNRLKALKLKNNYVLVLLQEDIGSEYFLNDKSLFLDSIPCESLFLEMLGSKTQLALQESRSGDSNIEIACKKAMDDLNIDHKTGAYNTIAGNDEKLWETYGIPMASLSRYPYPEYHCSLDNPTIISEESLETSVQILLKTVENLEKTKFVYKKFEGNICLSNPKYDLYVGYAQPAFGEEVTEEMTKMFELMNLVPILHKPRTIAWIANKVGMDEEAVELYLRKWEERGLVEIK